jgi:hypothetical protein
MDFIKKNIKKILNEKNRKYLIVAIVITAFVVHLYFSNKKENFGKEQEENIEEAKILLKKIPHGGRPNKKGAIKRVWRFLKKPRFNKKGRDYILKSLRNLEELTETKEDKFIIGKIAVLLNLGLAPPQEQPAQEQPAQEQPAQEQRAQEQEQPAREQPAVPKGPEGPGDVLRDLEAILKNTVNEKNHGAIQNVISKLERERANITKIKNNQIDMNSGVGEGGRLQEEQPAQPIKKIPVAWEKTEYGYKAPQKSEYMKEHMKWDANQVPESWSSNEEIDAAMEQLIINDNKILEQQRDQIQGVCNRFMSTFPTDNEKINVQAHNGLLRNNKNYQSKVKMMKNICGGGRN